MPARLATMLHPRRLIEWAVASLIAASAAGLAFTAALAAAIARGGLEQPSGPRVLAAEALLIAGGVAVTLAARRVLVTPSGESAGDPLRPPSRARPFDAVAGAIGVAAGGLGGGIATGDAVAGVTAGAAVAVVLMVLYAIKHPLKTLTTGLGLPLVLLLSAAGIEVAAASASQWPGAATMLAAGLALLLVVALAGRAAGAAAPRAWLAAGLLLVAGLGSFLHGVDGVLAGRHPPGRPSFTVSALPDLLDPLGDPERVCTAVQTWRAADGIGTAAGKAPAARRPGCIAARPAGRGPQVSSLALVRLHAAVDTFVFAPLYAAALILLLRLAAARIGSLFPESIEEPDAELVGRVTLLETYRTITSLAVPLALLAMSADIVENTATSALAAGHWNGIEAAGLLRAATAVLWGFSALKWAAIGLVLLALVVAAGAVASRVPDRVRELRRGLVAVRLSLVVTGGLMLALRHEQAVDVIRGWDDAQEHLVAALVLAVALGFACRYSAGRLLYGNSGEGGSRLVLSGGIGLAALAAAIRAPGLWIPVGIAIAIGLLSAPVRAVSDSPKQAPGYGRRSLLLLAAAMPVTALALAIIRAWTPPTLAAGIAGARRGTPMLWWDRGGWLVLVAFALLAAVVPAVRRLGEWRSQEATALGWRVLAAPAVVGIVAAGAALGDAHAWGARLGPLGLVLAFLVAVVLVLAIALGLAAEWRSPAFFRALRFRDTPVITLLLVWLLVATRLDAGGYHDAERIRLDAAFGGVTVQGVFDDWRARNCVPEASSRGGAAQRKRGVPLVLVASSGGGIRAAYWTARVLDDVLLEGDARGAVPCRVQRSQRIIAASGVSGGSVGLASAAARLVSGPTLRESACGGPADEPRERDWVRERLGCDYLAPAMAWHTFVEGPRALARWDLDGSETADRARILEQAFERAWPRIGNIDPARLPRCPAVRANAADRSYLALGLKEIWCLYPQVPLLMLNGTDVATSCRVNVSVLDAGLSIRRTPGANGWSVEPPDCLSVSPFTGGNGPGWGERAPPPYRGGLASTIDLADLLCGREDLRLSTAAVLSARFPWVLPSGRLEQPGRCAGGLREPPRGGPPNTPPPPVTYVVDGGYLDTSGASPLLELWSAWGRMVDAYNQSARDTCIVPFFVQVDNGYEEPPAPDPAPRPAELGVPLATQRAGMGARAAQARQAAALQFDAAYGYTGRAGADALRFRARYAGGAALDSRWEQLAPRSSDAFRAPLGWVLSKHAMNHLDDQAKLLGATGGPIRTVQRWLSTPLECVPER